MKRYLSSSIGKKQIVAISGLAMVLFLIAHLSGNLLIYKGPQALNTYAEFLHSLGNILWVARIGLIAAFVLHFTFIVLLVLQNKKARDVQYAKPLHPKTRNLSTQLMRASGFILFAYIFIHLYDYTFTSATPDNALVDGEYLGIYGLVWNSFLNPIRSIWYIVSMIAIGFHLTHAVQSVFQTFGFNHPSYTPIIKKISTVTGVIIAGSFASIPAYVLLSSFMAH